MADQQDYAAYESGRSRPPPGTFNFIPIQIANEQASKEAAALDSSLVPFPIFDMVEVSPLMPLFEVTPEQDFATTHPGCSDCCKSFTKLVFLFYNYLVILYYPAAVCLKEYIRFAGYFVYYFCVVPSRYYANYFMRPLIDAHYRCIKPKIILLQLLHVRPCIALYSQCCQACWDPVCGNGGGVKIEANVGEQV